MLYLLLGVLTMVYAHTEVVRVEVLDVFPQVFIEKVGYNSLKHGAIQRHQAAAKRLKGSHLQGHSKVIAPLEIKEEKSVTNICKSGS